MSGKIQCFGNHSLFANLFLISLSREYMSFTVFVFCIVFFVKCLSSIQPIFFLFSFK